MCLSFNISSTAYISRTQWSGLFFLFSPPQEIEFKKAGEHKSPLWSAHSGYSVNAC